MVFIWKKFHGFASAVVLLLAVTANLSASIKAHHFHSSHRNCVIHVKTTIQEAIDRAKPGCIIKIPAFGYYNEQVIIPPHLTGLTIIGGTGATLDAFGFDFGVIAVPPNVTPISSTSPGKNCPMKGIKNLRIQNLTVINGNLGGILLVGAKNFSIVDCVFGANGTNGLLTSCSTNGKISRCASYEQPNIGIYVSTCKDVTVDRNLVHDNPFGIVIENSLGCTIKLNKGFNNNTDIALTNVPNLPITENKHNTVLNNHFHEKQ